MFYPCLIYQSITDKIELDESASCVGRQIESLQNFFPCTIGAENKVPTGILEMRLELVPKTTEGVTEDVIAAQIALQKNRQAERERLFLVYAKQWWKEYLQIRPSHRDRLVKIFAQV